MQRMGGMGTPPGGREVGARASRGRGKDRRQPPGGVPTAGPSWGRPRSSWPPLRRTQPGAALLGHTTPGGDRGAWRPGSVSPAVGRQRFPSGGGGPAAAGGRRGRGPRLLGMQFSVTVSSVAKRKWKNRHEYGCQGSGRAQGGPRGREGGCPRRGGCRVPGANAQAGGGPGGSGAGPGRSLPAPSSRGALRGLCSVSSQTRSLPRRPRKIHGLKNQSRFQGQPERAAPHRQGGWAAPGVALRGSHGTKGPRDLCRPSPRGEAQALASVSPSVKHVISVKVIAIPRVWRGRWEGAPPAAHAARLGGGRRPAPVARGNRGDRPGRLPRPLARC